MKINNDDIFLFPNKTPSWWRRGSWRWRWPSIWSTSWRSGLARRRILGMEQTPWDLNLTPVSLVVRLFCVKILLPGGLLLPSLLHRHSRGWVSLFPGSFFVNLSFCRINKNLWSSLTSRQRTPSTTTIKLSLLINKKTFTLLNFFFLSACCGKAGFQEPWDVPGFQERWTPLVRPNQRHRRSDPQELLDSYEEANWVVAKICKRVFQIFFFYFAIIFGPVLPKMVYKYTTKSFKFLDPRITVSWCRAHQIPIERVRPDQNVLCP